MAAKANDITGNRYSRLVVTSFHGHGKRGSQTVRLWNCVCDCGKTTVTSYGSLTCGNVRSCGCLLRDATTTHGMSKSPVYKVWHAMLERCRNSHNQAWKDYGGRGIRVCERWHDFSNFNSDMGERPTGGTLDRIDVNGDYEPSNCRWVSQSINANNRRNNRIIEFRGELATLAQWARKCNLNKGALLYRLAHGWPIEAALTTPSDRSASNISTRSRLKKERRVSSQ